MYIKILITIWVSKLSSVALKVLGKGQGTALPGLVALKINKKILTHFAKQIPNIIIITGTNGKTTTQTILTNILTKADFKFISNASGSNLRRGLVSILIKECNIFGKVNYDYAIFEIEEATLSAIVEELTPNQIIVTNLYRDQLDAYGEIDRTQMFIKDGIKKSPQATCILNADDPKVALLSHGYPNQTMYYSIGEQFRNTFNYEGNFNKKLEINPSIATDIKVHDDLTSTFRFLDKQYKLQIPGIFHIYNTIAAISSAKLLKVSNEVIEASIISSKPAFGRGEIIDYQDSKYQVLLVKNPAGATLTLELIKNIKNINLIFLLNDKIADGRDVSWIWDAEYEILNQMDINNIYVSGIRGWDMLLRIKYVSSTPVKNLSKNTFSANINNREVIITIFDTIPELIKHTSEKNSTYYVMPTYTAMLKLRKVLTGKAIKV